MVSLLLQYDITPDVAGLKELLAVPEDPGIVEATVYVLVTWDKEAGNLSLCMVDR